MFWLILVIIVVGFFIVRANNGGSARKPLPIPKRIELIRELIAKHQDYLGREYKQQLEEEKNLRYEKHIPGSATLIWDKDTEKYLQDRYDDLLNYIQLNAILCERLRNDEQQLFEQVCDWGGYLENLVYISRERANDNMYADYVGVPPRDEVADAERRGIMQETYERIMARAKAQGVLTKNLIPSVL